MLPSIHKLQPGDLTPGTETFEQLVAGKGFRLELIRSHGDASAEGFWYDQDEDEWVALIFGTAILEFGEGTLELEAGDALTIQAHRRHRVAATSVDAVWLALHLSNRDG